MKKYKKIIILTIIIFLLDLISKVLITSYLDLNNSINIIGDFFKINLVHNYGAAFSILTDKTLFIIIISIIALILIIYMIKKDNKLTKLNIIYYSFILGGILGNLCNRLCLGYVIDFLDFNIFGYEFPIFNLADTFIVISIILMIFELFKGSDENEYS